MWCHMTWNAKASGCEQQDRKSCKGKNATKDKVQLSTPPVKASHSPPFWHSFTAQNQPDLLAAGDPLGSSYIMH